MVKKEDDCPLCHGTGQILAECSEEGMKYMPCTCQYFCELFNKKPIFGIPCPHPINLDGDLCYEGCGFIKGNEDKD